MKTSILSQFAADTIQSPATVTGGGGLVPRLLSSLLGKTKIDLGVDVGCAIKVDADINIGGGGGRGYGCSPRPSCH